VPVVRHPPVLKLTVFEAQSVGCARGGVSVWAHTADQHLGSFEAFVNSLQ
jgi:hypothetical protein